MHQIETPIACIGCQCCTDGCPVQIPIPQIFACANQKLRGEGNPQEIYDHFPVNGSNCISCCQCIYSCPQELQVPQLLEQVHKLFR